MGVPIDPRSSAPAGARITAASAWAGRLNYPHRLPARLDPAPPRRSMTARERTLPYTRPTRKTDWQRGFPLGGAPRRGSARRRSAAPPGGRCCWLMTQTRCSRRRSRPAPPRRPRWPTSTAGTWAGSSTPSATNGKSAGPLANGRPPDTTIAPVCVAGRPEAGPVWRATPALVPNTRLLHCPGAASTTTRGCVGD